jgi:hypothetical protein
MESSEEHTTKDTDCPPQLKARMVMRSNGVDSAKVGPVSRGWVLDRPVQERKREKLS